MALPRFVEVEQKLYSRRVEDVPAAVRAACQAAGLPGRIRRGARIGITVGSRGIDNIALIARAAVALIEEAGGRPFVLPAMGSHGGATAEGQTALLRALGVTPESVGAPVRAAMAAVQIGETTSGVPVYAAREALEADGLVVMNRIKQHTDFAGEYESGLVKMLAVGAGKRDGAAAMHSRQCASLTQDVPEAAAALIARLNVIGGLAILENGRHQTAEIVGVAPDEILARERALLRKVKRNAARLPFPEIDLLIVDWIGKDISGVGFDTHVIGRRMVWNEPEFRGPRIRVIAALDLSDGSKGNALGIGLADLTTERLLRKVDWEALRTNVLHTSFLNRAKVPLALPSDRELLRAAMVTLGEPDPAEVRVARIADTLRLDRFWISERLLDEARRRTRIRVLGEPRALSFDGRGDLERLPR